MIRQRLPDCRRCLQLAVEILRGPSPVRRRKCAGFVFRRLRKIFRAAEKSKVIGRLRRKRFQPAWYLPVGIFYDKIDMRFLVDVVKKREGGGKHEYAHGREAAKEQHDQALVSGGDS